MKKLINLWHELGESINPGETENGKVKKISNICLVFMGASLITLIMNILQHKTFYMTLATAILTGGFLAAFLAVTVFKRPGVASFLSLLMAGFIFSFFVLIGGNDGFAALWVMLVPLISMYLINLRMGILLSLYFLLFLIAFFYTPLRGIIEDYYTSTFLNRFPIVYFCAFFLTTVQMVQYHTSVLKQQKYRAELETAVEQERERVMTVEWEKQKAIMAKETQERFLANISHEIRTPINGIMGMNKLILDEDTSETVAEYAHNVDRSSKMLLSIVNDILDFSKLEQGKIDIVRVRYELMSVLEDLEWMIKEQVKDGVSFKVDYAASLPAVLEGDDVRVKQVLLNLLSNAVKYTKSGSIIFAVWGEGEGEDFVLHASVRDTGIGMKPEDIPHIFESFTRLDELKNRSIQGTGLGLAITKLLVDTMGGSINVESVYGSGSTFSVSLPQKVLDATPLNDYKTQKKQSEDTAVDISKLRILAIDDNMVNLVVITSFLKKAGNTPVTGRSGEEAIEASRKERFDYILMDHMMPGMDGITAMKAIRADETNPNHDTRIYVVTANAVTGMKEEYLAEGFDGYLSKPLQYNDLMGLFK